MKSPENKLFELHNFSLIQRACDTCREFSRFSLISGPPGIGKTIGLTHYKDKNSEKVKYVRVRQSMHISHFLEELLNQYELKKSYLKPNYHALNAIKEFHESCDEKYLLIIDEGGKLKRNQFGIIHELRDLTENKLGIIMSGPNYFVEKLKEWIDKDIDGIPEFYRRINFQLTLEKLRKEEIIAVCEAYNIKDRYNQKQFFNNTTIAGLINQIHNYLFYKRLTSEEQVSDDDN